MDLKETAKMMLIPGYGTAKLIEGVFGADDKKKSIKQLEEQAIRQRLEQQIWEAKAKTLQEIAIAKRIETAEVVEIEEYYDLSGEAGAKLGTDGVAVQAGASAAGRSVSKRVYRFTGCEKDSAAANDGLTESELWEKKMEQIEQLNKS